MNSKAGTKSSNASSNQPAIRILVAEDETLIRMDLVEMLTESGYEVVAQATKVSKAISDLKAIES